MISATPPSTTGTAFTSMAVVRLATSAILPISVGEMASRKETFRYECDVAVDLVDVTVWRCPHCGEFEVEIPRLAQLHRVIEVDREGNIVFMIEHLNSPSDADRLPNGHTIVAENGGIREFDRRGVLVFERSGAWAVEVNRY